MDIPKAPFYTHTMPRDTPMQEGVVSGKVTINLSSQVEEILGVSGAMVGNSKSKYRSEHPDNTVYFNACIFIEDGTQVWFGDIDLDVSRDKLQEVADALGQKIFVTPETPYRFNGLQEGLRKIRDLKEHGYEDKYGPIEFIPGSN